MIEGLRRTGATEAQVGEFERLEDGEVAEILARTFTDLEQQGVLRMMLRPQDSVIRAELKWGA